MSRLLTVDEVAARLRLHPMTVRRHIKSGRIRATRIGRAVRIPEDALEESGPKPELTREEWIAKVLEPPTPQELEHRRRVGEEMERLRMPIDIPTGVLKRVARREDEFVYGDKSMEDVIAEEMEYEKD